MKDNSAGFFNYIKDCLKLFAVFLKIGLFTFGGGYSMLPLVENEFAKKRNLYTEKELADIMVLSQVSPGIIAVNLATFIGYKQKKFLGALFSVLGFVLPTMLVIIIISFFIEGFNSIKVIKWMFFGMRAGVIIIVAKALWMMQKSMKRDFFSLLIFIAALMCAVLTNMDIIFILLSAMIFGILAKAGMGIYSKHYKQENK